MLTNKPNRYGSLISQYVNIFSSTFVPVYQHYDALGSTAAITTSAQAVVNSYHYGAWGDIVSSTEGIFNNFKWVGELGYYYDMQVEDYYVRARNYSPRQARWYSQDPIIRRRWMWPYLYTNRPVKWIDASGKQTQTKIQVSKQVDPSYSFGTAPLVTTEGSFLQQVLGDYLWGTWDPLAVFMGNDETLLEDKFKVFYSPAVGRNSVTTRKTKSVYLRQIGRKYEDRFWNGPYADPANPPLGETIRYDGGVKYVDGPLGIAIGTVSGSLEMFVQNASIVQNTHGGSCYMMKMEVIWTLNDEVDFREFESLYNKLPADAPLVQKIATVLEGAADVVGDEWMSLNYDMDVRWKETVEIWATSNRSGWGDENNSGLGRSGW